MRTRCGLARTGLMGAAAVSALMTAAVAHAQTASAPRGVTIGEVVVTAQKRSENLQKASVAVTALTSDRIQQANIAQPVQLQFNVPSMTFGNSDGYSYLTLRGVGNDTTVNAESSVATYLDGVYTGSLIAESIPTYDLARIEVLRGPQGTLYGRNTTGGVINYITKDPNFRPGAEGAFSYGNYNAKQVDLGVTGPILEDKIAGRLSVHYSDHDGYRRNIVTNDRDYWHDNFSARASLLFKPTDNFRAIVRADLSHDKTADSFGVIDATPLDGVTGAAFPVGVFSLPAAVLAATPGLLSPADIARLNGGSIASFYGLQQPGPPPPDPLKTLDIATAVPPLFIADTRGLSATLDWDLGAASVKSITAYRRARLWFRNDSGGIGSPSVDFDPLVQDSKQFTQEIDVSGKSFDNKLDWLVGAFYFKGSDDVSTDVWLPAFGDFINASVNLANRSGTPYAFALTPSFVNFMNLLPPNVLSTVVAGGVDPRTGLPLAPFSTIPPTAFLGFQALQDSRSIAGFFQGTYHVTDRLRITGGFRYTQDQKSSVRSVQSNLVYFLTGGNPGPSLCNKEESSRTWGAATGMATIEYDLAPRVMTYAKWSRGYKGGGMNAGECAHIYDPEYLTSYEVGLKSIFFDSQVLANIATYHYDYNNIQFTTYINNASAILNAGSATATGVELEYTIQPHALGGLSFDGFVSFEKSAYGPGCFNDPANQAGVIPLDANGNPPKACPAGVAAYAQINGNGLIRAPKWKANIGAQYLFDLSNSGTVVARVEGAYTDDIYNDIFNGKAKYESAVTQPGYTLLNARLTWTSADKRFAAILFGDNLTNKLYATNRVGFNTPATVDNVAGQFAPPRTFGVRFIAKFGSER